MLIGSESSPASGKDEMYEIVARQLVEDYERAQSNDPISPIQFQLDRLNSEDSDQGFSLIGAGERAGNSVQKIITASLEQISAVGSPRTPSDELSVPPSSLLKRALKGANSPSKTSEIGVKKLKKAPAPSLFLTEEHQAACAYWRSRLRCANDGNLVFVEDSPRQPEISEFLCLDD